METAMPNEVWEYTPTARSWEYRYSDDAPLIVDAPKRGKFPLRSLDAVALTLLACVVLWFAHQFRTERVHAAAAAPTPRFASFHDCKPFLPGVQPEQLDGDPTHTQFHPYNYTVCDGVEVTLWSEIR